MDSGLRYSAAAGEIQGGTAFQERPVIAGVCGGLAKALGWNSTSVRILYVVGSILSAAFPGAFASIILRAVMPEV